MEIKISNTDRDEALSVVLNELATIAKDGGATKVSENFELDGAKGGLLLGIVIALGGNIAASAIYDALKYLVRRHGERLNPSSRISVNEELTTVADIDNLEDQD
jgi:hypothetical protein